MKPYSENVKMDTEEDLSMCGRFLLTESSVQAAQTLVSIPEWIQNELHFGDIFPSMSSLVIERDPRTSALCAGFLSFGYLYGDRKQRMINARAETVETKWMFRKAFASSRVAVVCSAFYEWDSAKQKVAFSEPGRTMYLAALRLDDAFVILTREANASVAPWHHRMPVVLNADQAGEWILSDDDARTLLKSASPALSHTITQSRPKQTTLF